MFASLRKVQEIANATIGPRSALKPVPVTVGTSDESDLEIVEEPDRVEIKPDDSIGFTFVKEKRKLLMPEKVYGSSE